MTIVSVVGIVFLFLLPIYETNTFNSVHFQNNSNPLSRRRFLTPRDFHGTYIRFLDVSENSTLCPNTIIHTSNGVLYPTGYIHLSFHHIIHDGHLCVGPGDLALRFRRTINSKQIQREFNITPQASGIDNMVRDILLDLDGFYFGSQTNERNCHSSSFPANVAFFFTSQAKPFAANVGVPFHHNHKIMFIVDKTRICAFSGSFTQPRQKVTKLQPSPAISRTPKPYATSLPNQPPKSPADPKKLERPRKKNLNSTITEEFTPREPKERVQSNQTNTLGSPAKLESTPVPSMQYIESSPHSPRDKKTQETKKMMENSMLGSMPSTSGTGSVNKAMIHDTTQYDSKKKNSNLDLDVMSSSPSPSTPPHEPPEESSSFHDKRSSESGLQSSRPSRSPSNSISQTFAIPSRPSSSPTTHRYKIFPPSVSPRLPSAIPSIKVPSPTPHSIVLTGGNISPSPPPQISNGEMNHSYPHFHGFQGSESMIDTTASPPLATWEEIIGDSGSTCFPSSAAVLLSNGTIRRMDELRVGVHASVGYGQSSKVIDFTHFDHTTVSAFLRFQTDSGNNLTVTSSHFVHTCNVLMPTMKVMLGYYLKLSNGRCTQVTNVSTILSRGLFNPQTFHGDIVVDGFIVSTYTLAAAPMTAHALLAPVRLIYTCGFRTRLVSKLAQQKAIVRTFMSLFSSRELSETF